MSLSVDGVWAVGVWDQTVWADGVWREGEYVAPAVVEEDQQNTGGFWFAYEQEMYRRESERKKLKKKKEKAQKIKDEIEMQLALEARKQEENEQREDELRQLAFLVDEYKADIQRSLDQRILKTAEEAFRKQTFSSLEKLEREVFIMKEEEEFIMQAAAIILSAN
jgi:TPP-dependent pyruvate/acetoin dehydrogenase alpha subunit